MLLNKKVKVLHIELRKNIGGIERFLLNIYQVIDKENFQFDFITTEVAPSLTSEINKLGGNIYQVKPYKYIFQNRKDIMNVLKNNYDVIHIHKNSASNIIPFILASKAKVPIIIAHSHNTAPSNTLSGIYKYLIISLHYINKNRLFTLSDYHLACSTEAGKWLYGNKRKDSFSLVKNGIITENFIYNEEANIKKRKELNISKDSLVIGNIGRFSEQKNHEFLIDIFYQIYKKYNNSYLILVGTGKLQQQIENKVENLGLNNNVFFLGMRKDIADLLNVMDAFVLPSLYEGLPVVGIEAQASGLPLFIADTVSKEVEITEGVTWFSLKDPSDKIAECIIKKTLNDKKQNKKIRYERNKQVEKAGYNIKQSVKYLSKIYAGGV